ncbi:MAG: inorganic diphosphatase [Bacteroidetes bacterium]|nr:inorganic diphosphatase [Bacteroidota bacterium]
MNPWHDVIVGQEAPQFVNTVIEVPKNTRAKYELDKKSGFLRLKSVIYSSTYYPANYGFIPKTWCADKDPLDILVLGQIDVVPMCIVDAKVIGVMRMHQGNEQDDKIIAVAANDESVCHVEEIDQLPAHFISELKTFFANYKKSENKTTMLDEFQGKDVALGIVSKAIEDYRSRYV